jgi:CheY-like chemotaxis protein
MNSLLVVVDDDADSRAILAQFFRGAGYEVCAAPNGREALIALASAVPGLDDLLACVNRVRLDPAPTC